VGGGLCGNCRGSRDFRSDVGVAPYGFVVRTQYKTIAHTPPPSLRA